MNIMSQSYSILKLYEIMSLHIIKTLLIKLPVNVWPSLLARYWIQIEIGINSYGDKTRNDWDMISELKVMQ